MAIMVEREAKSDFEVKQVPEEIELPKHLSEIKKVETAFTANVKDGSGQNLTQTPQNQQTNITIPSDPKTLAALAKGSDEDSGTWFGVWWLRAIKRALHLGWSVVVGGKNVS